MRAIPLTFAGETVKIKVKNKSLVKVLKPKLLKPARGLLPKTLERLKGRLEDFFQPGRRVLFLINDATRPTPSRLVLETLRGWLRRVEACYLIACGAHPPPSKEELEKILGSLPLESGRVRFNLSKEKSEFEELGETSLGTPIRLNREALKAEKVFVIGSVEPHYFAGFTGGRKSILPGIASYSSIERNHMLALKPGAEALRLKGNPVHEDMMEAAEVFAEGREVFSLQTVLDGRRRIAGVFAGSLRQAFEEAVEVASSLYAVKVEEKADIVVAVARPPLDRDLYQAHKALEHGRRALKEGGIIILVASCRGGIGSEQFFKLLTLHNHPGKVLEAVREGYRLGYHKAYRIAELALKAEIWAVTELEASLLRKAFMKPYRSLQKALEEAFKVKGADARVFVIPDAGLTVPKPFSPE